MGKIEAYLSPRELARYLGLSVEDVRNLIDRDEFETIQLNGNLKVRKTEIDRWLDEEVKPRDLLELADELETEIDGDKVLNELDNASGDNYTDEEGS